MTTKTLKQASQDMHDAVKQLSTTQGIDWSDPLYGSVARAHASLHDALIRAEEDGGIDWAVLRDSVEGAGFFVSKGAPDAPADYLWGLIRKVYLTIVRRGANGQPQA